MELSNCPPNSAAPLLRCNNVAREKNATYFELDNWDDVTKGLEEDQVWKINRNFLEDQISQGKKIAFSHDPDAAVPGTFFWKEVNYLKDMAKEKGKELYFKKRNDGLWEAINNE